MHLHRFWKRKGPCRVGCRPIPYIACPHICFEWLQRGGNLLRYCVLLTMKKLYALTLFSLLCGALFAQDLSVTQIEGIKTFHRYDELDNTVTVANTGIVAVTGYFYVTVYRSIDSKLDGIDTKIGSLFVTKGVPAGGMLNVPLNEIMIKDNGSSYPYNLIVVVDSENSVKETDETNNNYAASGYTMLDANVDLVYSSFTLNQSSYAANDRLNINLAIQNLQPSNLGGYINNSFYLSTDNVLDSKDTFLDYSSWSFVGPDYATLTMNIPLPSVALGNYYVIARVDDYRGTTSIAETNETNNTVVTPIAITQSNIELTIPTIDAVEFYNGGGNYLGLMTTFQLRNNGATPASGYYVSAYLSPTPELQPDAVPFTNARAFGYWGYIKGGEQLTLTNLFNAAEGTYNYGPQYFILVVNTGGADAARIEESDYTNNTMVYTVPIVIGAPGQTFTILSAALDGQVDAADRQLMVNATIMNQGNTTNIATGHHITIVDAVQHVVFETYRYDYPQVAPGNIATLQWPLSLSDPLPVGDYMLNIDCVTNTANCGGSYSVPFTVIAPSYTLGGNVIGEDNVPLTKGKLFLYQKSPTGDVKFINKIDPTQTDLFSFPVDNQPYTLYFIPDRTAFPEYVPTIWGKTTTLNDNSFMELDANANVVLEVLKLAPWPTGNKVIQGSVQTGTGEGSRVGISTGRTQALEEVPVVLLSKDGAPIRLTYTDAEGNYTFNDLPADEYRVFAHLPIDGPHLEAPVAVNVTRNSATVSLEVSDNGTVVNDTEPYFKPQTITFVALPEKQYGDTPFAIDAATDSGLPLIYTSSAPAVATIENGNIIIHAVGTTDITASQSGDDDYKAADAVTRTLVVSAITGTESGRESITLFPNPTADFISIQGATRISRISVSDALGKQIPNISFTNEKLDLRPITPGIYFLTLQDASGVKVFRIIKE